MSEISVRNWEQINQASLMRELAQVRAVLEKLVPASEALKSAEAVEVAAERVTAVPPEAPAAVPPEVMDPPTAIVSLCSTFGLTGFERKILLMCAGVELDSRFAALVAAVNKDPRQPLPTFSLALAAFEDAHWSALLPSQPLRFWRMVELVPGDTLTTSPLRIDERILHYLAGMPAIDERLRSSTEPVHSHEGIPPSQRAVAEQAANTWSRTGGKLPWPVVQVCGSDVASRRAVAAAACALAGIHLRVMPVPSAPRLTSEIELFIRLWEREAALHPTGLLIEYDETETSDANLDSALKKLIETLRSPLIISTRERHRPLECRILSFEVPKVTPTEQIELWKEALGSAATSLNGSVETLATQFSLSAGSIYAAVAQAPDDSTDAGLWDACRMQARPRLEGLAQRIDPAATWDDLVLPDMQKHLLRQIAIQVRQRTRVYHEWGFASKGARGLGISALFAGPSGTGKTMAGEVLADELRLDLYRIDLSQVVSKYIGETEKNLRRVFDAAEGGGAILLFDEADALFGKRSEVKDSHDRYANIEVGYLLQRMEAYRGLAILTTNRKEALDFAFLRRLRFVVEFPFPEASQRAEIWRRIFPNATPTEGLRVDRLARLSAAGGNIYNIAMGAAFLAADAGEPVRMSHLLAAARSEFTKIERPLTDMETAGWV